MVETLEYLLVFGVTIALAGFSVAFFSSSLPVLHQSQASAEFDELTGAASSAALEGTAEVTLPLSDGSLACSGGVMSFSTGGLSYSSSIGYPCSFSYPDLSCVCSLVFSLNSTGVALEVNS